MNERLYNGDNVNEDRVLLQECLTQIQDCEWFFKDSSVELDWILQEGKMRLGFLYLEDKKPVQFLESLLINGKDENQIDTVLMEIFSFYSDLYQEQDTKTKDEINAFLSAIPLLLKVVQNTESMQGDITETEILEAIKQLCIGKSPSSDGLTSSFYKDFAEKLAPILYHVFNKAFAISSVSMNQYLAIIILLYKHGQQNVLTNYRPISLTNTDYKILAYVLTNRLELHLPFLISPQQTAYMKGCFIGQISEVCRISLITPLRTTLCILCYFWISRRHLTVFHTGSCFSCSNI